VNVRAQESRPAAKVRGASEAADRMVDSDMMPAWIAAELESKENPRGYLCDARKDGAIRLQRMPFCLGCISGAKNHNQGCPENLPGLSVHSLRKESSTSIGVYSVSVPSSGDQFYHFSQTAIRIRPRTQRLCQSRAHSIQEQGARRTRLERIETRDITVELLWG
jgi:hypothetical protein